MQKRIVTLLIVLSMTISAVLTGCGAEKNSDTQPQSSVESSDKQSVEQSVDSSEEVEELEPYTVTWWMRGEESKDHNKIMELVNARIQETLPNTELEIIWVASSEYKDRWNKALAGGEKIDIGWSASWVWNPKTDVNNGMLLDVEELLKEHGQGIIDAVGGMDILDMNRIKGGIYHILAWQGLVGGRYALYVNQAATDALPEGWLEESSKIFKANSGFSVEDKMAILDRIEEGMEIVEDAGALGEGLAKGAMSNVLENKSSENGMVFRNYIVGVALEDGVYTVFPWFHNETYKAYADKLNEWYNRGWYRSDVLSADASYKAEHAMYVNTAVSSTFAAKESQNKGWPLNGCLMQESNLLIQGYDTGVVFPITGENPERSMQVLNLVYTDAELYRLLVYGVEGEHYVTNADGTITRPAKDNRTYTGMDNWTLGTCINGLAESADTVGFYEDMLEEQKKAGRNPLTEFSFTAADWDVQTEATNLTAVFREYDGCFFAKDYEERYAEFEKQMNAAGMAKYMEAFKKALSEYVEANGLGTVAP